LARLNEERFPEEQTVMAKSYEALVDSDTRVDVNTGILAASRLQSILDSRAGQPNLLEIRVQVNRIIDAVRSTVPESMWGDIARKLDGAVKADDRTDDDMEEFDRDDDEYDINLTDDDDDVW
jgi:hypothetical protein